MVLSRCRRRKWVCLNSLSATSWRLRRSRLGLRPHEPARAAAPVPAPKPGATLGAGPSGPAPQASRENVAAAVTPRVDVRKVDTTPTKNEGPGLSAAELEALVGFQRRATAAAGRDFTLTAIGVGGIGAAAGRTRRGRSAKSSTKSGKKKKKKKKKYSSFFDPKETLKLVAGVGVVVGVLAPWAGAIPSCGFRWGASCA